MRQTKRIPKAAFDQESVIAQAVAGFRRPWPEPGNPLLLCYQENRCFPTSTHGDVIAITWHALYWTGRRPVAVAPSRGQSYRVYLHNDADFLLCRVNDPADHRAGVQGMHS